MQRRTLRHHYTPRQSAFRTRDRCAHTTPAPRPRRLQDPRRPVAGVCDLRRVAPSHTGGLQRRCSAGALRSVTARVTVAHPLGVLTHAPPCDPEKNDCESQRTGERSGGWACSEVAGVSGSWGHASLRHAGPKAPHKTARLGNGRGTCPMSGRNEPQPAAVDRSCDFPIFCSAPLRVLAIYRGQLVSPQTPCPWVCHPAL